MAPGQLVRHVVELDPHRIGLARLQRLRVFVAVAVAQVQHRVTQPRHGAVGPDRVEPHRHVGHRLVGAELEVQHRGTHQVGIGRERRAVEGQRARVVAPLVTRELRAEPDDAVFATVGAGGLRRRQRAPGGRPPGRAQSVVVQVQAAQFVPVARPRAVADPAPGNARHRGAGAAQVHDVGAKRGVALDAGIGVLEPPVPPAQRLLQKADTRLGQREMRVPVGPRPDDALDRRLDRAHQARHRIRVRVVPAADGQHGGLDSADVLVHRAVFPVGVAVRVLQPRDRQQRLGLQPLQPHGAPALAHQGRVRRARGVGEHGGRPAQVFIQQAAALVVDVVAVAVVGGAQRDDGLQPGRAQGSHLQAVEAAPRNTHHADPPGAPGLPHQPRDHVHRVVQFLLRVFVEHQPVGVAVAAHVDPHAGITVAGDVGVRQGIAHMGAVALAVGQVLQDHRHRILVCVGRHPDARRQLRAVGQCDEGVGDFTHLAREGFDGFHGSVPCSAMRVRRL